MRINFVIVLSTNEENEYYICLYKMFYVWA